MTLLTDIAAADWSNATRTLYSGTAPTPTTLAGWIAEEVWENSRRTVTPAVGIIPYYYLLMLPEGIGGLAFVVPPIPDTDILLGAVRHGARIGGTPIYYPRIEGSVMHSARIGGTPQHEL